MIEVPQIEKYIGEPIDLMMEREAGAPNDIPAQLVGFATWQKYNEKESGKLGYPVHNIDIEFFRSKVPADKQSDSCRPSTERDRLRFPNAYAAFKKRGAATVNGMPIEQWPQITRGQAHGLKVNDIHSVESLAEIHDSHIDKLGHAARELRTKARAFLAQAKDTAEAQRVAAENERKDQQIAELQRQINDLASKLQDEPKRGPGRPRKDEAA